MNNDSNIFKVLGIAYDGSFYISHIEVNGNVKTVHICRDAKPTFCPFCASRMHSNRVYVRTVNHPVLQDTTHIILKVHQRRWICTNPDCKTPVNESFSFLEPRAQSTNMTFYYVCEALKDLNRTTASVARQFNLSDTQVHDIFTSHVDLPALPLSEYISIDEVYLNIGNKDKYAFVIMDFLTGEIIDIVHNRWASTLREYFYRIPSEKRKGVKAIISDAYSPYLDFPDWFFPNAHSILDSFHVIKFLINKLNLYINNVMRKYQKNDRERLEIKNHDTNSDHKSIKESPEVVLLRNYRWVLLKNKSDINYSTKPYYHKALMMNIDTFKIESLFLSLDDKFERMRFLKEKYIEFNRKKFDDLEQAALELDLLINEYKASGISEFEEFSVLLKKYKTEILNSFSDVIVSRRTPEQDEVYYSRLSNGPMESFNRKPKDYKRNARGFSNFDYTRNRILWATRKNPTYLGIPKKKKEVHSFKGKKRGKYKKKN